MQVFGQNLFALTAAQRDLFRGQQMGIIFQALHLIGTLNITENLLLAQYLARQKQDRQHIQHLLEQLQIQHRQFALPNDLSQGEAQRVAIARAIINRPVLLLADEPTASLDDQNAEQVLTLIQQLAQEAGSTLLVISHDARIKSAFRHQLILRATA